MTGCTDRAVLDRIAALTFAWLDNRRLPAGDTVADIAFELSATGRRATIDTPPCAPPRIRLVASEGMPL